MENTNQIIERVQTEAAILTDKAKEIAKVEGTEGEARAVEFLAQIKNRLKLLEHERKELTAPMNTALKRLNSRFKRISEPLKGAEDLVKAGIVAYRNSETFKARERERKEAEHKARLAAHAGDIDTVLEAKEQAEAADAPKHVETQSGKMHTRRVWKFEIEDADAIPREYLVPNESAIRKAVAEGKKINGVRSWSEDVPIIK